MFCGVEGGTPRADLPDHLRAGANGVVRRLVSCFVASRGGHQAASGSASGHRGREVDSDSDAKSDEVGCRHRQLCRQIRRRRAPGYS